MKKLMNFALISALALTAIIMASCSDKPKEYTVTVTQSAGGTVSVSREIATEGTLITATAIADNGYVFKSWSIEDEKGPLSLVQSYNDIATFSMPDQAVTVAAQFAEIEEEYTITVTQSAGGTVSSNPAASRAGLTVSLAAVPDEGYIVESWVVEGASGPVALKSSEGNAATFIMPAENVTAGAVFVEEAASEN